MAQRLAGQKIAVLVADGFEQVEMTGPVKALKQEGATVHLVSPNRGSVQGNNHREHGDRFQVDVVLAAAAPDAYDGLVIPGGVFSPDLLRTDPAALDFVRAFFAAAKPVGAICHGPQVLISADLVKGRTMTGFKAIQVDLANAGAKVVDEPVVIDDRLVTSRMPDDVPMFGARLVDTLARTHAAA